MLRRATKLIIFSVLAISIFLVLHKTVGLQQKVSRAAQIDIPTCKDAFLTAISEQKLPEAKQHYDQLKNHLPENDDFIQTIAPAYMADLYIQYAQKMAFNEQAYTRLLAEAKQLAPEHPYLLNPTRPEYLNPAYEEKLHVIAQEIDMLQDLIVKEEQLLEEEIKLVEAVIEDEIEQTKLLKKARTVLLSHSILTEDMTRLKVVKQAEIAASEINVQAQLENTIEKALEVITAASARPAIPDTKDVCRLSYYTRDSPLSACVDTIANDYYGPALFVIADAQDKPAFAFTQGPVTMFEYDLFCHLSGQCYKEASSIDVMVNELQSLLPNDTAMRPHRNAERKRQAVNQRRTTTLCTLAQ
jgi:hypothetical protein